MSTAEISTESRAGGTVAARPGTTSLGNSLLALLAIGAGLVLLATGAGSSVLGAVPLLVLGVAALAWAVVVLVRDRVPALRVSFATTVGAIIVWVVIEALASAGATTAPPLVPMLSSTLMLLVIAAVLAVRLRARDASSVATAERPARAPLTPGRYLLALFAGAAVVAALTTPALALTHAGAFAVPHGSHGSAHLGH